MNPSTALATVVVDELIRGGVHEAVLCPGSRNAPLSFALHEADRLGRLRLHVRIDERTAGFLALGLAKASRRPVPVVTTSGTAAVNLHPAVVEAEYSHVGLVAITADRPEELRDVGANQTIRQVGLYGSSVVFSHDLSADADPTVADWRRVVHHAFLAAWGSGARAPVHLNVALRDPLVPTDGEDWATALETPIERQQPSDVLLAMATRLSAGGNTVVVAGDGGRPDARALAEAGGWPLLAEPSSGHRAGPNALSTYRLLLDHLGDEVARVVVAGRSTLSRQVSTLLARDDVEVVRLSDVVPTPTVDGPGDEAWLRRWVDADRTARAAVAQVLADEPLNGLSVARTMAAAVPTNGLLVAGSSSSIRDLDLADPWDDAPLVLSNRGASGIDGTVSTAVGAALAHPGPAYALMGDLTFLHDNTGLVVGPAEPRPDLTVVVVNDDGGGLFTLLEQGDPRYADEFERLFGTPHGVDLATLCAATGTPHRLVGSDEELRAELVRQPSGIQVLEVRTDRARTRTLHARLRAAVHDAVT
jgi:2-succinyl-5-enolpyruvyl-6-hydroxy-3-cyclohexene-1-carboxylate synthase